jgi:pimeloyl-ACP methyl ester carboxylesterase
MRLFTLLQPTGSDINTVLWDLWIPPQYSLMTAHTLIVPNGTLYYEVRGSGPLFILIPGGNSDASVYKSMAVELSRRFRVVTYDRRGYSRSTYTSTSTPDHESRVLTDADDVACLIKHLSSGARATVFGSGSGAIVALTLFARHGELIRALVAHEPLAVSLLPNGEQTMEAVEPVYAEFRSAGARAAMKMYLEVRGSTDGIYAEHGDQYALANLEFWMEHEMRQYPRTKIDIDALKKNANRLLLVGGRDGKDLMPYQSNLMLAKRIGSEVIDLPGGHLGYKTHPKEFASEQLAALEQRHISQKAGTTGES